jgi:hypothetical protein
MWLLGILGVIFLIFIGIALFAMYLVVMVISVVAIIIFFVLFSFFPSLGVEGSFLVTLMIVVGGLAVMAWVGKLDNERKERERGGQ